jgi:hypothetical protein
MRLTFLQVIGKFYQRTGRPRVGDQEKHLRSPELHVGLSRVQQQQILPHLDFIERETSDRCNFNGSNALISVFPFSHVRGTPTSKENISNF